MFGRWGRLVLGTVLACSTGWGWRGEAPSYPQARTVDHSDDYHGVRVADPYRWLEDLGSAETQAFAHAQDDLTRRLLAAGSSFGTLRARLLELMDGEVVGVPIQAAGRLFFLRVPRGDKARPIASVLDRPEGEPRTLVDANAFPEEPRATLTAIFPSPDGKLLAYGVSRAGSNWFELRFVDVAGARSRPDVIDGLNRQAGIAWTQDGSGVYYSAFRRPPPGQERTAPLLNQALRLHRLGTASDADETLLFEPDHPDWTFAAQETDDRRYLVVTVREGASALTRILYRERTPGTGGRFVSLVGDGTAAHTFRGNQGPVFWLQTDADAPRGRVIAVDTRRPGREHWKDLIPQGRATLNFVNVVADRFIAVLAEDARPVVRIFDLSGRHERDVALPDLGTTFSGFLGRRGDRHAYFSFNGVSHPPGASVLRLDPRSGETQAFRAPRLAFRPADYETRQVFYRSHDGTRIPMFVASRRGLRLDRSHPLLLYAYGAGGWHAIPWFQPQVLAFMERGGVYALANVRGGGEYGEQWHQAGMRRRKQNSIDDLVAAAEYLVAEGYTSRPRLAVNGGSLSGPLAAAAIVQRPDVFGAALIDIPALDMLRYDRFTGGAGWRNELGSASDPDDFQALRAYSPYHNLRPGTCYPPVLITVGERDETAVPSHGYKFAAALQAAQGCANPVLLQVLWGGGHALGNTREQAATALAAQLAFLGKVLDSSAGPDGASPGARPSAR
jgi:prolyl oligopeptidase